MKPLHTVFLKGRASRVLVTCQSDFSIVAGISASTGATVLPCAITDVQYLVSGGVEGVRYVAELGAAGAQVSIDFAQEVSALILAADTFMAPVCTLNYSNNIE